MPLLPAEALGLGDGDAGHADFVKGLLPFIQLERLDDRLDFFHGALPSGLSLGAFRTTRNRLTLPLVTQPACQVDSSPHTPRIAFFHSFLEFHLLALRLPLTNTSQGPPPPLAP